MNLERLERALSDTNEVALGLENRAGAYLALYNAHPELIPALVEISLSQKPLGVRTSAAGYLKEIVTPWNDQSKLQASNKAARTSLKSALIRSLGRSVPEMIRSKFEAIALSIADAKESWEEAYNQIEDALESSHEEVVFGGLNLLLQISNSYKHKNSHLAELTERFSLKLERTLRQLLYSQNEPAYDLVSLIVGSYRAWVSQEFPVELATVESLDKWVFLLKTIIETPLNPQEPLLELCKQSVLAILWPTLYPTALRYPALTQRGVCCRARVCLSGSGWP